MTRDEIVEIAWDVGLFMRSHKFQDEPTKLERFAERIAALEREACARACEKQRDIFGSPQYASGQPMSSVGERFAAGRCAEVIRARGERK